MIVTRNQTVEEKNPKLQSISKHADKNDFNPNEINKNAIQYKNEHEESIYRQLRNNKRFKCYDIINIDIDFIEPNQNIPENYQYYVSRTLNSIVPLSHFNFSPYIEHKKIILDETNKKTLILDLDETLIHADFDGEYCHHDALINFKINEVDMSVPILIRPFLNLFLENMSELFEIIIFTASIKEYADAVLNFLDPYNNIFKYRFYRENCINLNNKIYIKDLRMFINRKLENIIIVDNSIYSFANQLSNGILINSFYHDTNDRELVNLYNYLQQVLLNCHDIRLLNEEMFSFSSLLQNNISKI